MGGYPAGLEKLGNRTFSEKRSEKLEKCMVLDSERQEKLDFFSETNKLNVCNYHYYSLLVPSDNE